MECNWPSRFGTDSDSFSNKQTFKIRLSNSIVSKLLHRARKSPYLKCRLNVDSMKKV